MRRNVFIFLKHKQKTYCLALLLPKSKTSFTRRKNETKLRRQLDQVRAALIAQVSFSITSVFHLHSYCDKKIFKKNSCSMFFLFKIFLLFIFQRKYLRSKANKKLGQGKPAMRLFCFFFVIFLIKKCCSR